MMLNVKQLFNQIKPRKAVLIYLFLSFLLILFYTRQANYNLNLLIHVNESMLNYNPSMQFKNLLVLKQEGYDGQFYYFISRYLYDKNIHDITLDSTTFRMLRIGSSILYGFIPFFIGWEYYTYWVLLIHYILFLFSYFEFYKVLDDNKKYLSIIYLFNPYVIISNMLLIGDTIFISLFMIFISVLMKINFDFDKKNQIEINNYYWFILILGMMIALTKETSLFYFITFGFIFLIKKDIKGIVLIIIPILVLLIWYILVHNYFHFHDLNPLSHTSRIRIPFLEMMGFYKNLLYSLSSLMDFMKSIPYFIILLLYLYLILLGFKVIIHSSKDFFYIIKNLILFFPIIIIVIIIAVVDLEYWLAFDNIFRIFSFAFLWLLFLDFKNKVNHLFGFYVLNLIITILLIFRYSIIKKIGAFFIL